MPRWVTQVPVVEQDWTSELFVLERHTNGIETIAFSPTDNLLVRTSSCERPGLWDYVTGTERFRFDEPMGCCCAAFSPDGKSVALGSSGGYISVKEFGKGSAIDLKGHDSTVSHLAFSPKSGKVLASTSYDHTLRIWNVDKRQTTHICRLQTGSEIFVAEFTPDGRFLIVGASVNMTMWNVETGECVKTFDEVDTSFVSAVAISMDGKNAACIQDRDMVILYNLSTGKQQFEAYNSNRQVGSILLLPPDENCVLIGLVGGSIELRDIGTWSVVRQFHTSDTACCFAVSRDGELLASGGFGDNFRLWDMRSVIENKVPERSSYPVDCVRFSPDDSLILSSRSKEPDAHVWDVADGSVRSLPVDPVQWVNFSPDGRYVVLELDGKICQLWNRSMTTQILDSKRLRKIVFSPDGSLMALFLTDGDVQMVDGTTFQEILTWEQVEDSIADIQFSPNGQIIGLVKNLFEYEFWNLPYRKRLWQSTTKNSHLFTSEGHFEFTLDGQVVASWLHTTEEYSNQETWQILEVATGSEKWVHLPHARHLVFHPESHLFAIEEGGSIHASSALYITIYETASLNLKHRFTLHAPVEAGFRTLLSMDISAKGKLVAASSRKLELNRTVHMWDTTTGMEIGRYSIKEEFGPLSFLDDRYLLCDQGRLPVPSSLPDQEETDSKKKQPDAQNCLFVGSEWVYQGTERILWLPPAYRSSASVLRGETLALVHETGKVRIVKFNPTEVPVSTVQRSGVHFPA